MDLGARSKFLAVLVFIELGHLTRKVRIKDHTFLGFETAWSFAKHPFNAGI